MIKNKTRYFLLFSLVLITIISMSAISASDINDNQTADLEFTDVQSSDTSYKIEADKNLVDTIDNNLNDNTNTAQISKNYTSNDVTTVDKSIKKFTTHILTQDTYPEIFGDDGNLADIVSDGDTIDVQGSILLNDKSMIINKAVNVISSTEDAYIDLNSVGSSPMFGVVHDGSYSNISGIYFHNTQLWVSNATHVTIDNVSAVVEDQRVGTGVGQTSIRDNSTFVTMKNSYIYTKDNGGSSSFVLTAVNNCTIDNCTIVGVGNVGNLFYINIYNHGIPNMFGPQVLMYYNKDNTISNCKIYGPETASAICWAVAITGQNNKVINNTINYSGTGISGVPSVCLNNTFNGGCGIPGGYNVTNCTFNDGGNLTISATNSNASGNYVTGTITVKGTNSSVDNNTVVTNNKYAVVVSATGVNVTNNYLNVKNGSLLGDEAVSPKSDTILINNTPLRIKINANDTTINVTDTAIIIANLTDSKENPVTSGNVTLRDSQGNIISNTDVSDGLASIPFSNSRAGVYTLTITYNDNRNYYTNSTTITVTLLKVDTVLTVDEIEDSLALEDSVVSGKLALNSGEGISDATINLTIIDGETSYQYNGKTDANGEYNIIVNNPIIGLDKEVIVNYYGNDTYNPSNTATTYSTYGRKANITVNTLVDTYLNTTTDIIFTVVDSITGESIQDSSVDVFVYPVTADKYDYQERLRTNENGKIEITNNNNVLGQIIVEANFINTEVYNSTGDDTNPAIRTSYTVNKILTNLTLDEIENVHMKTNTIVSGKATTDNGTVLRNANIIITVENNTYTVTTDENGKFSQVIENNKVSIVTVDVILEESDEYVTSSASRSYFVNKITTIITVENATTIVQKEVSIIANIIDEYGNPLSTGNAILTVDNQTVYSTINNGVITFPITPTNTGVFITYVVFNEDENYTQSNNASLLTVNKIKTTLTLYDIPDTTVQTNSTVQGTLRTDENPITNANIIITVENNTYTVTTDTNGEFSQVIENNIVANITVQADYNGDNIYEEATNVTTTYTISKKSSVLTIIEENTSAVNNTYTVKVTDENGNIVENGTVIIFDSNLNQILKANLTDGTARLTLSIGNKGYITIKYDGNEYYNETNETIYNNITKAATTTIVDSLTGVIKDTVTLKARVYDELGDPVNTGKVFFKINGVTLRDSNSNVNYADLVNGVASINYVIQKACSNENSTIEAIYIGTDLYNSSRSVNNTVNVSKRTVDIVVSAGSNNVTSGSTIKLRAFITDNGNVINTGRVIFKINGLTVKDADGNVVYVDVVNGSAEYNYEVPYGWSAKNCTLTAVYSNSVYTRAEANDTFIVVKDSTHIIVSPVHTSLNNTKTQITATIYSSKNKEVNGNTQVAIKINNKTYKTITAVNGSINTTIDTSLLKENNYNLTILTGENSRYLAANTNTTLLIE